MKFLIAATALCAGLALAQGPGRGMPQAAQAKGPVAHHPIPRAADGKPDLSGTWQSGGVSINGEAGAPPIHPLPPIDVARYMPEVSIAVTFDDSLNAMPCFSCRR